MVGTQIQMRSWSTYLTILVLAVTELSTVAHGGGKGKGKGKKGHDSLSNTNRVDICVLNPFQPSKFRTREVNQNLEEFFLLLGNRAGRCDDNCAILCDDGDACTVDDGGSCERDGCPSFPRKAVDCDVGFKCDNSLGCIPEASATQTPTSSPAIIPPGTPAPSIVGESETDTPTPIPSPAAPATPAPSIFEGAEIETLAPSPSTYPPVTLTPSTAGESETVKPTPSPSVVSPDTPVPSAGQPETETPTSSPSTLQSAPEQSRPRRCTTNPMVYGVNVDIQVDIPGGSFSICREDQWYEIQRLVSATLNVKFTTAVPDWHGDVSFGPTSFDGYQRVNNARKLLRGAEQQHRMLAVCANERNIACEADVCHWGCLIAPTTSCGVNSLTNWFRLGTELQAALAALEYDCLGSPVVNILVEDPSDFS